MEEATYAEGFHDPEKVKKMSYVQFGNTGLRVSKLSFGGGPAGGVYGSVSEEQAISTVVAAVRSGVNYIDTAPWYGHGKSEEVIGKALKQVPRKAYYIGTKVGRYSPDHESMFDFSKERVLKGFETSLQLLQLDYVDVIQVHDLEFAEDINQVINETLPALQTLVDAGKARFIGVTGYDVGLLRSVIEKSKIKISAVLSYARNTLIDDALLEHLPYFKEQGLGVVNACAVCMGLLTMDGPRFWHPASQDIKDAATKAAHYCKEEGADIAEVAIYYSLATEGVHTNLMGSNSLEIFNKNFETVTTPPTDDHINLARVVKDRFFQSLPKKHWEGQDPENHWKILKMIRGEIPQTEEIKPFKF